MNKIKYIKREKIILYLSLFFLVLSILITYLGYRYENHKLPKPLNLKEISSKKNQVNKYSYIDVNTKPYLFASYKGENNKFYFVMDKDNYLYIVYMSNESFKKLDKETIITEPIRINGLTKEINLDIKNLAIDIYNDLIKNEYLNKNNFNNYVGMYYLDIESSYYDASLYYTLSGVFLVLFMITIIYLRKGIKKTKVDELNLLKTSVKIHKKDNLKYKKNSKK